MAYGPISTPRRPAPRSIGTPTMPTSRVVSATRGLLSCLIVIEAAPGFPSQIASGHHLAQERGRGEAGLLELVKENVGNIESRIEADVVQQRKRTHRIA